MNIDLDLARKLLDYDPNTGVFTWKGSSYPRMGTAGTLSQSGYVKIYIAGRPVRAHRLAFALAHGYWPQQVGHRDGDRANNRAVNLRACSIQQRQWNAHKQNRETTSQFKGVYWCRQRNKWRARIVEDRRAIELGFYDDEKEAGAAYSRAAQRIAGEFARVVT